MNYYDGVLGQLKKVAEWNGYEGKRGTFTLLQVWEDERASVLVPLKDPFKLKVFKGKKFSLITPRWDSPMELKTGTETVLGLL